MKKKLSLKLAAGLVCAAMLAGCGSGSSGTEPQTIGEPTQAAEERRRRDGGGRTGGGTGTDLRTQQ